MIRNIIKSDASRICEIYNYYVETTTISFEDSSIKVDDMKNRIVSISAQFPWIVYIKNSEIIGYAYFIKWKGRSAYKNSVESTVYLDNKVIGKGIGSQLLGELINRAKQSHIHAIIGGIALPNVASIKIHEKFGFEKVAHFKEVGFKFNKWIDVGYWELLL